MPQAYVTFDELPGWVQEPVRKFRGGDAHDWVFRPVPALDNTSVMELMNHGEAGVARVREYLEQVAGKFLM